MAEWFENQSKFIESEDGSYSLYKGGLIGKNQKIFCNRAVQSASSGKSSIFPVNFQNREYLPAKGRGWSTNKDGFRRLIRAGRLLSTSNALRYKPYYHDYPLKILTNGWNDTVTSGAEDDKVYVVVP